MKKIKYCFGLVALLLVACSSDESEKVFVPGEPVNLTLNLANDSDAPTRAMVNPDGTVYVKSDKSTVTKSYTYDSENNKFVSDNPLVWLAKEMKITGYYYRINGVAGELSFLYTVDKAKTKPAIARDKKKSPIQPMLVWSFANSWPR